jgi:hypothetical protein
MKRFLIDVLATSVILIPLLYFTGVPLWAIPPAVATGVLYAYARRYRDRRWLGKDY